MSAASDQGFFDACTARLDSLVPLALEGRVCSLVGNLIEGEGLDLRLGSMCEIGSRALGASVHAEVIGVSVDGRGNGPDHHVQHRRCGNARGRLRDAERIGAPVGWRHDGAHPYHHVGRYALRSRRNGYGSDHRWLQDEFAKWEAQQREYKQQLNGLLRKVSLAGLGDRSV